MSNVSIYQKSWINLVFEGKNKEYGAYQLRQESSKTTILALIYGLLFVFSVSGLGLLLSSFGTKPEVIPEKIPLDVVIHVDNLTIKKPKTKKATIPIKKAVTIPDNSKQLVNPTIVKSTDTKDDIIKPNTANVTPTDTSGGATTGTVIATGGISSGVTNTKTEIKDISPKSTDMLDKMPQFPGGMNKFYTYVGNHFEKPEIELDQTITVYVSFVIEIDGSLSNIKVIKDPGYGLGKEAIRVLNSLKTKWTPGMIKGEKVRTAYHLPISVKIE